MANKMDTIDKLMQIIKDQEAEITELKLTISEKYGHMGRKSRFSDEEKEHMFELKKEGKALRDIAAIYNCCHVTVANILKKME